jgi:hypothetical protein
VAQQLLHGLQVSGRVEQALAAVWRALCILSPDVVPAASSPLHPLHRNPLHGRASCFRTLRAQPVLKRGRGRGLGRRNSLTAAISSEFFDRHGWSCVSALFTDDKRASTLGRARSHELRIRRESDDGQVLLRLVRTGNRRGRRSDRSRLGAPGSSRHDGDLLRVCEERCGVCPSGRAARSTGVQATTCVTTRVRSRACSG